MAKKKQNIQLVGLDDLNFEKEPDIQAAESIVKQEPKAEPAKKKAPEKEATAPKAKKPVAPKPKKEPKPEPKKLARGTMPPVNKKRASFNISEDLHRALKAYSFFEEVDMVEYVFENLVKKDLTKKGYYPPKKRK